MGRDCYMAWLRWDPLGDCSRKWNAPIHAGLFLEEGNLTFYRRWGNDCWHSSGIICEDMPSEVLPCVFMSSFIGYAQVNFVRMWSTPPDVCHGCDSFKARPCGRLAACASFKCIEVRTRCRD